MNINDFVGTWSIQYKSGGEKTPLQNGWRLEIGTGEFGAQAPFLSAEGAVCVGFALIDPSTSPPEVIIATDDHEGNQPALLRLTGDQLRWKGYYQRQPAYIYISAAQTWVPGGESYTHLYGSTTYGDPDQVAVWGGSGTPPPPPSPKEDDGDEG
ncbi:MAG TPA: hypothetical protein VGP73_22585 [Thermoanaerobaculia bacterium]